MKTFLFLFCFSVFFFFVLFFFLGGGGGGVIKIVIMLFSLLILMYFIYCQTYVGSVLFRTSAFTGAKLASGVQAVIGCFGSW